MIEVGEKLDAVVLRFIEQGLSAEETAMRMDIPIDFILSCLDYMEGKKNEPDNRTNKA